MKEITVQELKKMKDDGDDFQLIDVREQNEHDFVNIGGDLIPMSGIIDNQDKISKDKKVVCYCRSGSRSAQVVMALEQRFGFDQIYNLAGGILAYADEIDPSLPKY